MSMASNNPQGGATPKLILASELLEAFRVRQVMNLPNFAYP